MDTEIFRLSGKLFGLDGNLEDLIPHIAALPGGAFVVVWRGSTPDGQDVDIFTQQFDAAGNPVSGTRLQGMAGNLLDTSPQITTLADGGYIVTWQGNTSDGQTVDIFLQRFDAAGTQVSDDRLQGMPGQADNLPQITALPDGGYVVTWQGATSDGQGWDIFVRQFDAAGTQVADARLQGIAGSTDDLASQVAALSDGGYVVTWTQASSADQSSEIQVQQFDAAGNQVANAILRGMDGLLQDNTQQITALEDGGYVVTWQGQTSDGQRTDIFLRQFDAAGNEIADARLTALAGSRNDIGPQIAALGDGGYVVVWRGPDPAGLTADVYLQQFDADGNQTVATRLEGMAGSLIDLVPQIAGLAGGGYVVVWQGKTSDGQDNDIFVREFNRNGVLVGEARLQAFAQSVNDTNPQVTALDDGSYVVSWTATTPDGQGNDVFVKAFGAPPPCFVRGTLIETATGPVSVERLAAGDMLRTMDHGFQPVRLVCHTACDSIDLQMRPAIRPVRIMAAALGNGLPQRDLLVSPQHRMLVSSRIAQRMFGTAEVLIPAIRLTALPGVFLDEEVTAVEYFHVLLDVHEVIFAEGAPSESLLTGPQALRSLGAAAREEIRALLPELAEAGYTPHPVRAVPQGRRQRKLVERHIKNRHPMLRTS